MIELEGICKLYQVGGFGVEALSDVALTIRRGEMVSITGASGSGKSTLMNIIGLLDRPSTGRYRLDGQDVASLSADHLAEVRNRQIGFIFQSFHLLPRLTALDNVALPLFYRGLPQPVRRAVALEWLERVDMSGRAHHTPDALSGGQRQRVAIARALVGRPGLILADEPTGSLDSRTGGEIMDLFLRLNADCGVTTLIITHDPTVAARCQRRLVLHDGRITGDTGPTRNATPAGEDGAINAQR